MTFKVGDIGTMLLVPEGRQYIPENCLLCDGKSYRKEDYPELFQIYGYNRNRADPPDTFRVPNQNPVIASNAVVQLIIRAV